MPFFLEQMTAIVAVAPNGDVVKLRPLKAGKWLVDIFRNGKLRSSYRAESYEVAKKHFDHAKIRGCAY
jgi:hypothetical protein